MFSSFFGVSEGIQIGGRRIRPAPNASEEDEEDNATEVGVDILEAMDILRIEPVQVNAGNTSALREAEPVEVMMEDLEQILKRNSQQMCFSKPVFRGITTSRHPKLPKGFSRSISQSSSGVFSDKQTLFQERGRMKAKRAWNKRKRYCPMGLPNLDTKGFTRSQRYKRICIEFAASMKGEAAIMSTSLFPSSNQSHLWSSSNVVVLFHNSNGWTSESVSGADVFLSEAGAMVATFSEEKKVLFNVQASEIETVFYDLESAPVCLVRIKSSSNSIPDSEKRWFSLQLPSTSCLQSLLPALELSARRHPRRLPGLFQHLPLSESLFLGSTTSFFQPQEASYSEAKSGHRLFKESHLMFQEIDDLLRDSSDRWQSGKFLLKLNTLFLSTEEEEHNDQELPKRFWILNESSEVAVEPLRDSEVLRPHSFRLRLSMSEVLDVSTSCSEERTQWIGLLKEAIKFQNCDALAHSPKQSVVPGAPDKSLATRWNHPVMAVEENTGRMSLFHFKGRAVSEVRRFGGEQEPLLDMVRGGGKQKIELLFRHGGRLKLSFPDVNSCSKFEKDQKAKLFC